MVDVGEGNPDGSGRTGSNSVRRSRLSEIDPDLFASDSQGDVAVTVRHVPPSTWDVPVGDGMGVLVVRGLLAQSISLAGNRSVVLAWDGDVIAPDLAYPDWADRGMHVHVLEPSVLAELDADFMKSIRKRPAVLLSIGERLRRVLARTQLLVAVSHLSRVEHRILGTLLLIAEDRGRATVGGILLRVPLTHERLGELVGARRPTVSLALRELEAMDLVRKTDEGAWLIGHDAADYIRTVRAAVNPGSVD